MSMMNLRTVGLPCILLVMPCLVMGLLASTGHADITFTNVTSQSGISHVSQSMASACFGDYDGDGDLDLYVVSYGNPHEPSLPRDNVLYRNNGDRTFEDKSITNMANVGDTGYGVGGVFVDYNNDGNLDLYVTNYWNQANILYQNNGHLAFVNVAESAKVAGNQCSQASTFGDYDSDGYLDLYVANGEYQSDILYRNDGSEAFEDMTSITEISDNRTSVTPCFFDYDNDGDLDIYVTCGGPTGPAPNMLYCNNGDDTFNDISQEAGVDDSGAARGLAIGDYNNDGYMDIYIANSGKTDILYQNNRDGSFSDVTLEAEVSNTFDGSGAVAGDFDNNGYLDIYVVNGRNQPNILYMNNGDGTFTDVASDAKVDSTEHGLTPACADYDGDGYLDLYVAGYGDDILYRNNGNGNSWLQFRLIGVVSNRDGVGSKILVKAGDLSMKREIWAVSAYTSQSLWAHFGLGSNNQADTVEIIWPSGTVDVLRNVLSDQNITVVEGSSPDKAASIYVDPAPISFGDVFYCSAKSVYISIGNSGDAILQVINIESDLGSILQISETAFSVEPGKYHEIILTLDLPNGHDIGEINGTLTISSNASSSPTEIAISAESKTDAVGCPLYPKEFCAEKLTRASWKATIAEYGTDGPIRIEFNSVRFEGGDGAYGMTVYAMIQNVYHQFNNEEDNYIDCYNQQVVPAEAGIGLYFSCQEEGLDHGVELSQSLQTGNEFEFDRVFENIDAFYNIIGNNIYTKQAIGKPPIALEWIVTKTGTYTLTNRMDLTRNLDCTPKALSGEFVRWTFQVSINGAMYEVAHYYLPKTHAEYLDRDSPIELHQEYLSGCCSQLDANRCKVKYRDLKVFDVDGYCFSIDKWEIGYGGNPPSSSCDEGYGWYTEWYDDRQYLCSSAGRDEDADDCRRDEGTVFDLTVDRLLGDFAGYKWYVRSGYEYPGPNYWSDGNARLSPDGLHLRISECNGRWYCAEVYTEETFSYGEYAFYVASKEIEELDQNVVLGLFTWDNTSFQEHANSEVDIEFGKLGHSDSKMLQYSVQPTNESENEERYERYPIELNGDYSTHVFTWTQDRVSFSSYHDHGNPTEDPIAGWEFPLDPNNPPRRKRDRDGNLSDLVLIPGPGNDTKVHLNLWLLNGEAPSSNGEDEGEVEIIIRDFEFKPIEVVSNRLTVQAFSPVDIEITDPAGRTISRTESAIPSATYVQVDLTGDGNPDDKVIMPDGLLGNYLIEVVPEPGASATDIYTLEVIYDGKPTRLAENVEIQKLPDEPYCFFLPRHRMDEGWNLMSLPLWPPDTDPGAVLSSLGTKYNSVWAYDPIAGWSIYAPGVPSDLQEIVPYKGYWIKMDEPGTLTVQGTVPESTAVLLKGAKWNLAGYCSLEFKDVEECNLPDCISSVWEYNADKGWSIYAPGGSSDLETMKPGFGYWIKVREDHPDDCVWDVNQPSPPAAPPLAVRSGSEHALEDRPEMPYMIWGSVEVDGKKITGDSTVILKMDGKIQSSYALGTMKGYGDSYVLDVPIATDNSSLCELYVQVDDELTRAAPLPPGEPGQVIRLDLSVRIPPKVSMLLQNFPNPFNPDTWIPYQLREDANVVIKIYTATGQLVQTLNLGHQPAGFYTTKSKAAYWDGKNEAGEEVASGIYFYTIQAGNFTAIKKMIIAR